MTAYVIMANDYPEGVHICDDEGEAKAIMEAKRKQHFRERYAAQMSYESYKQQIFWRVYPFEPSGLQKTFIGHHKTDTADHTFVAFGLSESDARESYQKMHPIYADMLELTQLKPACMPMHFCEET